MTTLPSINSVQPGQTWRRKRNGKLVTIKGLRKYLPQGSDTDHYSFMVEYTMDKGRDGSSWMPNFFQAFEPADLPKQTTVTHEEYRVAYRNLSGTESYTDPLQSQKKVEGSFRSYADRLAQIGRVITYLRTEKRTITTTTTDWS